MEVMRTQAMMLLATVSAAACAQNGPSPHFNDIGSTATHFAAFSVLNASVGSLEIVLGPVERRTEGPVFRTSGPGCTEQECNPWEHNVDNGYSSVLYDPDNSAGQGQYRAFYSAGDPGFPAVPGCPPSECGAGSAVLYATSEDGIRWVKPKLGRYEWQNSTANNIMFTGTTAVGVYDDGWRERNASQRFKVWGNVADGTAQDGESEVERSVLPWKRPQIAGSAVSADGVNWKHYRRLQNVTDPDRHTDRFDAAACLFYDPHQERYVGTMRAFRPCDDCGLCPIWWQPHGGCQSHLRSQCTAVQCNHTVRAIGMSTTSNSEFETTPWGANVQVNSDLIRGPMSQMYSQSTFPFYNIYLGITMLFDAVDPPEVYGKGKVHCELSYSYDTQTWHRVQPGQDFIPLGSIENRDFDSHICFAAAHPVKLDTGVRIYYMGGDGPHYSPPYGNSLHRNSSFGFATLRSDGFVALRATNGTGLGETVALDVQGPKLLLTADTAPGGSVTVRVRSVKDTLICDPVENSNVTDHTLGGCDLTSLVGSKAVVEFSVAGGAAVYTFAWSK